MSSCPGRTRHWFTGPAKIAGGTGVRSPICVQCGAANPRSLSQEEIEILAEVAPRLLPGDHPKHQHLWKMVFHADNCHSYYSTFSCRAAGCGAVKYNMDERDFMDDPYATIWAEGSDCTRCEELRKGAKPVSTEEIVETSR